LTFIELIKNKLKGSVSEAYTQMTKNDVKVWCWLFY